MREGFRFDVMPEYQYTLWLIAARRPDVVRKLERRVRKSQAQLVAELVDEFPYFLWRYADGAGTPEERLNAVRRLIAELYEEGDLAMAMREPN